MVKERPRIEVSAGAIVFRRSRQGVAVAMVVDSYGKWTFPKGHVRRGESFLDAARRESAEEMGVRDLRPVRKLGTIDIWFRDRFVFKGKLVHKFIHYFLFEASQNARLRVPRREEGGGENIQDVAWVPLEEVTARSKYKDLEKILQLALRTVRWMTR